MTSLTTPRLFALAAASAVVTANAYYIHPIVAPVAADFGIGPAMIGVVPAANQIALALGILLFLPLGDRIPNRKLATGFVAAQAVALFLMAWAEDFRLFAVGSTLLGLFTITPYLLPAYVSKRIPPARLGYATAVLTTGIIAGILLARVGAGAIAEYIGWRLVYWIAAALMLVTTVLLPLVMDAGERRERAGQTPYLTLLASLPSLAKRFPHVIMSGGIQALNFGIFLSVWLGIGLHLPAIGYGTDVVGALAALALVNLVTTPKLGAWSDRIGPRRARLRIAMMQLAGVALLGISGGSLVALIVPLILMNVAGPVIDVTGRMTFLNEEPDVRTRLMTIFIIMMFLGAGIASWAGTAAYALAGWSGTTGLALLLSAGVSLLSWQAMRTG
ncbi:MAG: MFS transporter [Pacificimonas sp.]